MTPWHHPWLYQFLQEQGSTLGAIATVTAVLTSLKLARLSIMPKAFVLLTDRQENSVRQDIIIFSNIGTVPIVLGRECLYLRFGLRKLYLFSAWDRSTGGSLLVPPGSTESITFLTMEMLANEITDGLKSFHFSAALLMRFGKLFVISQLGHKFPIRMAASSKERLLRDLRLIRSGI